MNNKTIIFTDGGSRGNPGPSGIGAVLYEEDGTTVIVAISKFIGHATNNEAEYLGVLYALQESVFLGIKNVVINVDSQLIARQLKGEYKVKDINLRKYYDIIKYLFKGFDEILIKEIPREQNKVADGLVNKAIDRGV